MARWLYSACRTSKEQQTQARKQVGQVTAHGTNDRFLPALSHAPWLRCRRPGGWATQRGRGRATGRGRGTGTAWGLLSVHTNTRGGQGGGCVFTSSSTLLRRRNTSRPHNATRAHTVTQAHTVKHSTPGEKIPAGGLVDCSTTRPHVAMGWWRCCCAGSVFRGL